MMKYIFIMSILLMSIIGLQIKDTTIGFCAEQKEEKMNNFVPSETPDVFSHLFSQRNQLYPNFNPISIKAKAISDPEEQFTQRKYINEYYRTKLKYLFPQITVPENVGVVFLPTEMKVRGTNKKLWRCLFSFFHEDINVTVVFLGKAVAITFEYEEDAQSSESLESICQKLSKFLPWMEHLIFSYDIPENQKTYQGNVLDEAKLYHVKARQEKVLLGNWVNSVRWWRGLGRFGISSNGGTAIKYMSPQELLRHPTLPIVPDLYKDFEFSE